MICGLVLYHVDQEIMYMHVHSELLIHWDQYQLAAICQTSFYNVFSL